MSRATIWAWARPLTGVAIIVVLFHRLGAEPFVEGLRRTDAEAIAVALVITAGTTWCCALRWSLLARALEVPVPPGAAYRACYRAQFLNATLPGGIVGDVHRGVRHGRDSRALGRGLRSVVWDRVSGQVVQVAMVVLALPLLPGPLRPWALAVAVCVVALGVAFRSEIRAVPADPALWGRVVLLSTLAAGGHVVVFLVAARTAGVTVPMLQIVPLALGVLLASAIPLNVAGWGPREGAAAWVFASAGLGAAAGLEVAVVYGVVSLVATFPGALALFGGRQSRRPADPEPLEPAEVRSA
jgi:uncharacterized membrane protein YbhN (UPF0104 family)